MYSFDIQTGILIIDNNEFPLDEEYYDEKGVLWNPEYKDVHDLNFTVTDYPNFLYIEISSEDGFGTSLFYEIEIGHDKDGMYFDFVSRQPNKYWEGKYGLATFLVAIKEIVDDTSDINTYNIEVDNDWKELQLRFRPKKGFILDRYVKECAERINKIIEQAELILSGVIWRKEYEADENLFCTELLFPLLRKMGFIDVRFTHGVKEYGKDFTFSEMTKFGNLMHYGLQVKAGDISGKVNAPIDEIIGQLEDAFSMPYWNVSATEERYISIFIVAISGHFADNAKDKIIKKVPGYFKGCVYFLDRDKIMELIENYWK
ncbi:MAG TPA: hypothetical protein VN026_17415 [Bacteroidia bacterium]|jgi:hypothetical protein|nr:hypothetical protein [Bacteroidia bacterium]